MRVSCIWRLLLTGCGWLFLPGAICTANAAELPPAADQEIDFVRDIQPLLVKRCHSCHGAEKHEGGLRLHKKADAYNGGDRGPAFSPGDSAGSRMVQFMGGQNDEELLMPPAGDGGPLPAEEIALFRAWIDQGANWPDAADLDLRSQHWSFQPVVRPALPSVTDAAWLRNPIDSFVLARLEALGIDPSPEADRPTLIRRLSLDLLGLPPAPAEVDEFVADTSPEAYERLVDRLLASPHYGERWGRHWLDQARYGDSDGYEKDNVRPHAWRWRNWVIDAFNRDLPFDQFTIEQIAGDLLPDATLEQRLATGFHRNTLTNTEGGADQEEFRVAATVDRVNTTGTVWLGLTVGCAQCHSHKYDPLTQREYYSLFAFFNSEQETSIPAPLPQEAEAFAQAQQAHADEQARLVAAVTAFERDQLPGRQAEWEKTALTTATVWTVLDPETATSAGGATLTKQADYSFLASGANPATDTYTIVARTPLTGITAVRLEVLPDPSLPAGGPGRVTHGNFVLSEFKLAATAQSDAAQTAMPVLQNASADFSQGADMREWPVAAAIDGNTATGWAVAPQYNQRHVAVFELAENLGFEGGTALTFTLDQQYGMQHTIGRPRLSISTSPRPVSATGLPDEVNALLQVAADQRTPEQQAALAAYYKGIDPQLAELTKAAAEHAKLAPVPSAMAPVLVELPAPRETHIHIRGDFLRKGEAVQPGTPAILPPLKQTEGGGSSVEGQQPPSRLDLARWLVDPAHPLTSRVTVNRLWQHYFGRALVASLDDFGTRGETPSHPELLDWLASEFVACGWSQKALHRLIVTSATYRQSSRVRPELVELDPANVLLARQARFRLEAETIRDVALAVSGLFNPAIGGPSVRPPQPAGISELTYANSAKWVESTGADRYRRGMYTHMQRTSPYPMLTTFDTPDANLCAVKRERSNTPLQALTLLNDTAFVECAQALGKRIVQEAPASADALQTAQERVRYAFRLSLAREPAPGEQERLERLYADLLAACQAVPEEAAKLAGPAPAEGVPAPEAAAWVALARTLMNLDEFVTRE